MKGNWKQQIKNDEKMKSEKSDWTQRRIQAKTSTWRVRLDDFLKTPFIWASLILCLYRPLQSLLIHCLLLVTFTKSLSFPVHFSFRQVVWKLDSTHAQGILTWCQGKRGPFMCFPFAIQLDTCQCKLWQIRNDGSNLATTGKENKIGRLVRIIMLLGQAC